MLKCEECEFYHRDDQGRIQLRCNPFSTIKEPECLMKLQLMRQDALLQAYHAMLNFYQRLAPMQEKMFRYMKREMDEMEETDQWKYQDEQEDEKDGEDEDFDRDTRY